MAQDLRNYINMNTLINKPFVPNAAMIPAAAIEMPGKFTCCAGVAADLAAITVSRGSHLEKPVGKGMVWSARSGVALSPLRLGVSLVEVIFAMGVVLIGLLGVMSILPLAGNRAKDAVGLTVGSAMSDNVLREMMSQRWLSSNRLVAFTDAGVPTQPTPPFCIDPLYPSLATVPGAVGNNPNISYDLRYFPYYLPKHDPSLDPSIAGSLDLTMPFSRMRRVGVMQNSLGGVLSRDQAYRIADSPDDLLLQRPKDKTLGPFRLGQPVSSLPYGSRINSGEYSWIATVVPNPSPGYVTVSVIVMRNRERGYSIPSGPAGNPEQNATSERLASISSWSGFKGGAGGVVELLSSDKTVSRLRSGDWLMLTHHSSQTNRWYRVAAVEGDSEFRQVSQAVVGVTTSRQMRPVWIRKVYLDGPDIAMGPAGVTSFGAFSVSSAFATLVEGVVSVTERVVRLSEL